VDTETKPEAIDQLIKTLADALAGVKAMAATIELLSAAVLHHEEEIVALKSRVEALERARTRRAKREFVCSRPVPKSNPSRGIVKRNKETAGGPIPGPGRSPTSDVVGFILRALTVPWRTGRSQAPLPDRPWLSRWSETVTRWLSDGPMVRIGGWCVRGVR
jgi:hypothetical protein